MKANRQTIDWEQYSQKEGELIQFDAPSRSCAVDAHFLSDQFFDVWAVRHDHVKIPLAIQVRETMIDQRFSGLACISVGFEKSSVLSSRVVMHPIRDADEIDPTPVAVMTKLPQLSLSDLVRREVRKLVPEKPSRETQGDDDDDDEISAAHRGRTYELPDDEPDDPLADPPADFVERHRSRKRVRKGDAGSDPKPDPDRSGPAKSEPVAGSPPEPAGDGN